MPTAFELGPSGWEPYLEASRRRRAKSPKPTTTSDDREKLLAALSRAAAVLRGRFGARRVIVFGSLARGDWFRSGSDVDIAVEGLSGDYWQAWGVVEESVPERRVDFVELEAVSPSLRAAIETEGVEL